MRHSLLAYVLLAPTAGCSQSSHHAQAPFCVGDGGSFVCLGETFPGCQEQTAEGPCEVDASPTCMGCIGASPAGYTCSCQPIGNGTGKWLCAGTGSSCELTP